MEETKPHGVQGPAPGHSVSERRSQVALKCNEAHVIYLDGLWMGQSHPQQDGIKTKIREENNEISMALRRRTIENEMLLKLFHSF